MLVLAEPHSVGLYEASSANHIDFNEKCNFGLYCNSQVFFLKQHVHLSQWKCLSARSHVLSRPHSALSADKTIRNTPFIFWMKFIMAKTTWKNTQKNYKYQFEHLQGNYTEGDDVKIQGLGRDGQMVDAILLHHGKCRIQLTTSGLVSYEGLNVRMRHYQLPPLNVLFLCLLILKSWFNGSLICWNFMVFVSVDYCCFWSKHFPPERSAVSTFSMFYVHLEWTFLESLRIKLLVI